MNTKTRGLVFAAVFTAAAATLSAGSLDYLSNQNASYFFSTAQTASTAGASIVPYNPAGTALLDKGFYLDASNQTILKFYDESEDKLLKSSYSQKDPTPFLPSLALAYNFGNVGPGKLSLYGNGGITAGGGTLNWKDGTIGTSAFLVKSGITTYTSSVEASSIYYGLGAGAGYSFLNDMVSVSAGARYVIANRTGKINGTATISGAVIDFSDEYQYNATGVTPIFGIDIRPVSGLTVGVRYEMETNLKFKYKTDSLSASPEVSTAMTQYIAAGLKSKLPNYDGVEVNQNLPQVLSLGAEYVFTPKFTLSAGTNLYFLGNADMNGGEDNFTTGYELNLAGQYQCTEKLLAGLTAMYSNQGTKNSFFESDSILLTSSANPPLDSVTLGGGVKYNAIKTLDLLLSTSYVYYFPKSATTASGLEVNYEKKVFNVCLGASYKF